MYRKEFLYINVYPRLIFLTKGRSNFSLSLSLYIFLPFSDRFAFNRLSFRRAFIVVSALHEQVRRTQVVYVYHTDGNECSSSFFYFFYFFFLSFSPSLLIPFLSFSSLVHELFLDKFVSRLQGIGFDRGFERNDEILRIHPSIYREGFPECIHWQWDSL